MTDNIKNLRNYFIAEKKHHQFRTTIENNYFLVEGFHTNKTSDIDRAVIRLKYVSDNELPIVLKDEKITLFRTMSEIPKIYIENELTNLGYHLHESGELCNICVDYTLLLNVGFGAKIKEIEIFIATFDKQNKPDKIKYLKSLISVLQSVQHLIKRYREEAKKVNNLTVYNSLSNIISKPPSSFLEALQLFRFIHFTMWSGGNYHNTIGRFDQFMYPYLKKDMDDGVLDYDSALELLEEFFISFNKDSDLYTGVQQGDNGQSIVLGGLNPDGSDSYNILSELCLKASLELKLIDPKINLRVHKNTTDDVYCLATELTKQGLGFPQYSNDDVVINGLMKLGYSEQDAHNYAVAACWEFIIPGVGLDIPNIAGLCFAANAVSAVAEHLLECESYDDLEKIVCENIQKTADEICKSTKDIYISPAPFISILMHGCIDNATDASLGSKYNNYGIHGTGLATAADSLAAIKKYVYDSQEITKHTLLDCIYKNFEGYDELLHKLRYNSPKMGNDDDYVDDIAIRLLDAFSNSLQGKTNTRGGIFRAGTGSAMFYIWHTRDMLATPDGRKRGEGLPANYSPSLFAKCKGPVSIIKSFTKPHLENAINGGPLTLELHDSLFRTEDSISKTAMMVKSFVVLGGHQLQLNAVNRDTMLEAQQHPENYQNLIVRVWGWSGYFVQLDKEYQDHIIQRMELVL